MLQAPVLDGLSFDPFPFQQDGLAAPEVDIGGREVIQALVVAPVVVVEFLLLTRMTYTWDGPSTSFL